MSRQVELSARMQAVADMVSPGNRVCDVGCDHGYVSIYLIQAGISPGVLAMDVNKGPLLRATEHVKQYGMEDYIQLRLSDGLLEYRKGEADTLLCAGMGGRLLMKILEREPDKTADFKELILQPQSELKLFRKYLREKGYLWEKETMILEDGKYYPMMKVRKFSDFAQVGESMGKEECGKNTSVSGEENRKITEMEDLLGPLLLQEKNQVLLAYIKQEITVKEGILEGLNKQKQKEKLLLRKQEIEKELVLLNDAVRMWY